MFGNEEGCNLQGKENERFVGRREAGMSVSMSLDGEQRKLLEQGGEAGRMVQKGSCGDWKEKPGGGGRKGES